MVRMIEVAGLHKTFTLHTQGGTQIPVFDRLNLTVDAGECLALCGPSGAGKSTLLRSIYANYRPQSGSIMIRHGGRMLDILAAEPRAVLDIRRRTMGYVSQFLRAIPRVPAVEVVADPLIQMGVAAADAKVRAKTMLARLRIPQRLMGLAPATFSGGEQQRVNIARSFAADYPILLLDEPTASLDTRNRETVITLIGEAKARGAAIVGIFHDDEVREAAADRLFEVEAYRVAA